MKLTINAETVSSQLIGANGEIMLDYSVKDYNLVIDAAGIVTGGQALISLFLKAKDEIEVAIVRARMESMGVAAACDTIERKLAAEQQADEERIRTERVRGDLRSAA